MSDSSNSATPEAKPRRQFFAALVAAIAGVGLMGTSRRAAAAPQSSQPFVGEVMLFAGNFAPAGWLACEGQLLSIAENETLFVLIGTTYGGDGQTTFGLPDLRGRTPIHAGQGPGLSPRGLGEVGGSEVVTLSTSQLPTHSHTALGDATAGSSDIPTGKVPARDAAGGLSWGTVSPVAMGAGHIASRGSGVAHENRNPYLALNYCIATFGIFPSPS